MTIRQEDLLSAEYVQTLRDTHATQKGWGAGGKYHSEMVLEFARELGATSILDYGCGQGLLKVKLGDVIDVREWDPGIPKKSAMPGPADLVVATDVIEHIEVDRVMVTLQHMRSLALKGMFAIIALSKAKLTLTDGRNAHLSLFTVEQWREKLNDANFKIIKESRRKGFWVWTT